MREEKAQVLNFVDFAFNELNRSLHLPLELLNFSLCHLALVELLNEHIQLLFHLFLAGLHLLLVLLVALELLIVLALFNFLDEPVDLALFLRVANVLSKFHNWLHDLKLYEGDAEDHEVQSHNAC